jgi:ATP-dependent protease ClpP protease subunit
VSTQRNKFVASPLTITEVLEGASAKPLFPIDRMVEYFGVVNYATNERVLNNIKELIRAFPSDTLYMMVTSAGGPSGTAMSFYDAVRHIVRPSLATIGSGDVDSSGLIIFLTGERRYVTRHTTALLHLAGRVFDSGKRMTAVEMEAVLREDRIKDEQYASIVAERSNGRLTKEKVLTLMQNNTTLLPEDFVRFGLADSVIG